MAKQDAVTIHPRDAEKDDTANGTCKDKQLKVPDLVDVAGLAIRDTPSNGPVIIPLERESSLSVSDSTSVPVKGAKGTVSVVETYIKPVLKLWQHQAVALNVQHTIRKQDQLQRLVHLEKSHRDTALVISQLQDQVQRLAENCAHQKKDQLQLRQEKDQKVLRASDESGPNEVVNLATLSGRQITHRAYSPLIHRYQHQHQQHPNGYYCSTRESHRADELIEAIAKGLEEYHAPLLITTSTTKKHWIVPEIPTNARAHPTSRSNLLRNPIVITTLFNTNGIKSNKHMQDSSKTTSWRYPLITLFMINLFVAENGAAA
ncbi:hypothetical protein BGX33_001422 [Mortierella sp. NVP41]|nr:hypothetical protein BGX33_001422 [Mortierella sp. NVP41]